jgi:hypothetical protein
VHCGAVGFGYCLRQPAPLLGGRQLGKEVNPVVNQLIVFLAANARCR